MQTLHSLHKILVSTQILIHCIIGVNLQCPMLVEKMTCTKTQTTYRCDALASYPIQRIVAARGIATVKHS